ncbi:YciI family protein [Evansella cellulosilytica]|uniref:YCII-related protein n=1 Tax=Evansella cellulosilytica (strain ATCC 21833 / DSM 2522 / FERM P-1141 / JCM 9156 / N-4) TaxID=649639 RepID=E6U1F9_EVAC2|nr:YciI family protein [Evansella cellulosilytica]ADU29206.1 YCII-related protein [Evansella cellulosilytica DSM 2522]
MKKFIVHFSNKQQELMTKELINDHVNYLKILKENGVLSFCGSCVDGTAFMIIDAPSIGKAKRYVENDPFSKVDYYIDRKIVEIKEATLENNFLLGKVLVNAEDE